MAASMLAGKLASDIVHENFGPIAEAVCRVLLLKGQLHLGGIIKESKLPPDQVKKSLMLLIQQNCVQAYRPPAPQSTTMAIRVMPLLYEPCVDIILHRTSFPEVLYYVNKTLGDDASLVLEGLLEHGRLTIPHMLDRAKARRTKESRSQDQIASLGAALRRTVGEMTRMRLIERAPPAELPVEATQQASKATGGRQSKEARLRAQLEEQAAQKRIERARGDAFRFSLPPSFLSDASGSHADDLLSEPTARDNGANGLANHGDDSSRPMKKAKAEEGNGVAAAATGLGPVGGAALRGGPHSAFDPQETILWRVNFEEFTRIFRHELCVKSIKRMFGWEAAVAVEVLLKLTRMANGSPQDNTSISKSLPILMLEIQKAWPGLVVDATIVEAAFRAAAELDDRLIIIKPSQGEGETFAVNVQGLIDKVKRLELDGIVRCRFGQSASRIFRLLQQHKMLEQKQVAEFAMLPVKETRETLYALLKTSILAIQEVPKSADKAPSRTYYLWRVDWQRVLDICKEDVLKAMLNVSLRLRFELEGQKEVISLLEQKLRDGATGEAPTTITAAQRKLLEKVRNVAQALEVSLLHLSRQRMLLFHF